LCWCTVEISYSGAVKPPIEDLVAGYEDASAAPGVWRFARASKVRVIVDGADYFDLVQRAMLKARQRILLIGWDFDTRIHLTNGRRWYQKGWRRQFPSRLGSFILWLSRKRPDLEIRILKWSFSILAMLMRGSMVFDLIRWARHRRIDFKFDSQHPIGCSHHQKIVVIDDNLAVCGGIDLTTGRWDTRDHAEGDARRKMPGGALYPPWHDVTMMMEGEVACALDQLGRVRWLRAGGKALREIAPGGPGAWPDGLEPHFTDVEIGIARTRAQWNGDAAVNEIEDLFLRQIAAARRFVYMENQYFASRSVCEAIARRLAQPDPPEFIVVQAERADGWLEGQAMDSARAELVLALEELDKHGQFHSYIPMSGATPIYVHAKLTIVDDCVIRVGSANINNRSMGLDSECDVFIDCARPGNAHASAAITALRHSLLAEHLGLPEADIAGLIEKNGSMAGLIAWAGTQNNRYLRPYHPEPIPSLSSDLALNQVLDPERPDEIFTIRETGRGLFRPGSLLTRARARLRRRKMQKDANAG
jgi:phosphatidylserine/phosphatidylglycerophosphate/cardiolipin synthase-like enzyme